MIVPRRGEIWWATAGPPSGSEPGYRPHVIVSANRLNESTLQTVLTIPLTRQLSREAYSGNVRIPAGGTGLAAPSIAIVNQISTTNRLILTERIGRVPDELMARIDVGLRMVLEL